MAKTRPANLSRTDCDANHAVKFLMDLCDDELVLMHDDELGLYLIPSVMTENSSERLPPGAIEYQLSDGPVDHRNYSEDFDSLTAAVRRFRELQGRGGWSVAR